VSGPIVQLGDVADFINGCAFKPSDWAETGLPIVRIQNLTGNGNAFNRTNIDVPDKHRVVSGDLLVSWSASLGVFRWTGPEAAVNQHIFKVVPDLRKVDLEYLRHALDASIHEMERFTHGSTMKHINRKEFLEHKIPLPPLEEQRRIAAILDKADALRRKRKRALELLDTLTQSIFVETFASADSAAWPLCSVESLATNIRTGPFGSQLLHSEFVQEGIAVLGIDNAVANKFRWGERRYITPRKYEELRRYTVLPGDVLITIMGTCGRCAVVPEDIPPAINTKHLCCITLDRDKCLPEVLQSALLRHPSILKQLGVQAKGAVMPGLNMGIIKSLAFPLPPLKIQEAYVRTTQELFQQINMAERALSQGDALFTSLQHRAFSGQL